MIFIDFVDVSVWQGNCLSDEQITQVLCDTQLKRRYKQQTKW